MAEVEDDQKAGRDKNTHEKNSGEEKSLSDDSLNLLKDHKLIGNNSKSSSDDVAGVKLELVDEYRNKPKTSPSSDASNGKKPNSDGPREKQDAGANDGRDAKAGKGGDNHSQNTGFRSDIEAARARLKEAGIDPDKVDVKVGVRELRSQNPMEERMGKLHATMVACAMRDPELGLSRDMPVKVIRDLIPNLGKLGDSSKSIEDAMAKTATKMVDTFTNTLKQQFLDPNNKEPLRVINASNGGTPADFAGMIYQRMQEHPQQFKNTLKELLGPEKANAWIREQKNNGNDGGGPPPLPNLKGTDKCVDLRKPGKEEGGDDKPPDVSPLSKELMQKLVGLSENVNKDPKFQESMERYRQTTKEVADKGGIIVVSAGNSGEFESINGVKLAPGSQYNWLAQSEHIIAVGSSDTNGTPGNALDDKVADHSSTGTSKYKPTVLSQGHDFLTRQMPDGRTDGTSFAAPTVANAIGLMLTQNSRLTFDEVKKLLQENTQVIPGVPEERQGAGVLSIDRAVIAARKSKY